MIDVKVDLDAVRQAKELKNQLYARLRQIDFENSGLITVDSFVNIAEKYGVKLTPQDAIAIKEQYRRQGISGQAFSSKVEYLRVLNDIKMGLDNQGQISWVFSSRFGKRGEASPYKVTIQRVEEQDSSDKLSKANSSIRNQLSVV